MPPKDRVVTVTVDGEDVEVTAETTPNEILVAAGLDPAKTYLIEIKGAKRESYKDNADEKIKVHANQKFITASRDPVTVSDSTLQGSALFAKQLEDSGIKADVDGSWIEVDFEVPAGTYQGKTVRLAIEVPPDFPRTPPGGVHFKPRLRPVNTNAEHPLRSHESKRFSDGEYWSRPYKDGWAESPDKSAKTYMRHVRTLWVTT